MIDFIKNKLRSLILENDVDKYQTLDPSNIKIKKQMVNNFLVFNPYYNGESMGGFRLSPYQDGYMLGKAVLYDRFKGQGIGTGMCKYIIKTLAKEGKKLYFDPNTSQEAKNMLDSLVKSGIIRKDGNVYLPI